MTSKDNYGIIIKDELKSKLLEYMDFQNVEYKGKSKGSFRCPNSHFHKNGDKNFSGSFKTGTNGEKWFCHGCKEGGDVFDMAWFIEGLPKSNVVEFYTVTIPHVAKVVNHKIDLDRYYQAIGDNTGGAVASSKKSIHTNIEKIENIIQKRKDPLKINGDYNRTYPDEIKQKLSDEFDIFFPQEKDFSFLPPVDNMEHPLDDKKVIKVGNLVFPIYNKYNDLIGFCARLPQSEIDKGFKKYRFTRALNQTDRINIFNAEKAKKPARETGLLYLFEGQFDCMMAYVSGITNSIAMGTTSDVEYLVKYCSEFNIKEIVLCLDNDKAGNNSTVKIYHDLLNTPLTTSLVLLPKDVDIDELIIKEGISPITDISKRKSIIEFILETNYGDLLKQDLSNNARYIIALQYAVEFSRTNATTSQYAKLIAEKFGLNISDVIYDLSRSLKLKRDPLIQKTNEIINASIQTILDESNPDEKINRLEKLSNETKDLYIDYAHSSISDTAKELDELLNQGDDTDRGLVYTGIPDIDKSVRLSPGDLWVIAGRASVGKSTLVRALISSITNANSNTLILHFSLDDTKKDAMDGIISNIGKIKNEIIMTNNYDSESRIKLEKAQSLMREWWGTRYYLIGQNGASSINDVKNLVTRFQIRNPEKQIIVFIDNLMNLASVATKQGSKREIVESELSELHVFGQAKNLIPIVLVEFRKSNSRRPGLIDLKETGAIEYRAKIITLLHNDLKHDPNSKIFWTNEQKSKRPVLELNFAKYKVGDPNQLVLLSMEPSFNSFVSPTESQFVTWKKIIDAQNTEKKSAINNNFEKDSDDEEEL